MSALYNSAKEAWQGAAAERWLQEHARTDELLHPFGQAAITTLAAQSGEWLLEVGCGAGTPTLELASQVGPHGGVLGVDVSAPLLQRARDRAAQAARSNLSFVLADAANHPFERSFDGVFSRFGVMFFDDPLGAFTHLRHALKPSGRLAFVCWQELARNPWAHKPLEAVCAVAPSQPLPSMLRPNQPGPFSLGHQDQLYELLVAAGFPHVDITPFERPVQLGTGSDAQAAADYCMAMGPAARFIEQADPAQSPAFRAAILQALEPHTSARGTWLDAATFVVNARR